MSIERILSPDLALEEKREANREKRRAAADQLELGTTVRAGRTGKPGKLENISPDGFASIRWEDGSLLTGVEADRIQVVTPRMELADWIRSLRNAPNCPFTRAKLRSICREMIGRAKEYHKTLEPQ